jgi:outer membrane assembly lipoprotein YfiO
MSLRTLPAAAALLALAACSSTEDSLPLAGTVNPSGDEARSLYQEASAADQAGDRRKAVKRYREFANKFPWAPEAPQARFRQAELLEQRGDTLEAFDAYQDFIGRYKGSDLYTRALERQARMAQAAADGEIKTSFLGLKAKLPTEKVVPMLEKIRDNAPASPAASRAQFAVGELYQSRGKGNESIAAYQKLVQDYPDSKEAAEAQYRIGVILVQQAERGNQDQANINRAREAFLDYLQNYPGHSKNDQARAQLAKLGGLDLQRSFDIAEFYLRKGNAESARFYYEDVVRRAKSGPLHDRAKARLGELPQP